MSRQEMDGLLDLLVEALILRLEEDDRLKRHVAGDFEVSETPPASQEFNDDRAF